MENIVLFLEKRR